MTQSTMFSCLFFFVFFFPPGRDSLKANNNPSPGSRKKKGSLAFDGLAKILNTTAAANGYSLSNLKDKISHLIQGFYVNLTCFCESNPVSSDPYLFGGLNIDLI